MPQAELKKLGVVVSIMLALLLCGASALVCLGAYYVRYGGYLSCVRALRLARKEWAGVEMAKLGARPSAAFSLRTQLDYLQFNLPWLRRHSRVDTIEWFTGELRASVDGVRELSRGRDPFANRRGAFLRSHYADVDSSAQPYSLYVPEDYNPRRPMPLVVSLHGHGWYEPFQGHPAPAMSGAIVLSPHGRGSTDYMYLGERDVLSAIGNVRAHYAIDPNRIYVRGSSMGGTGCWTLAVHYPDLFAAIAPICGNANHRVWRARWGWNPEVDGPMLDLCEFLEDTVSPVTLAENLLHVPSFCVHGDLDDVVPVEHSRSMTERLRSASCPVRYAEVPGLGHGGFPTDVMEEQLAWVGSRVKNPRPRRVRYKTGWLKYAGAYWVRIERFARYLRFARIEAELAAKSRVVVSTENVARFSLLRRQMPIHAADGMVVEIDGQVVQLGKAKGWTLSFERQGTQASWRPAGPSPRRGKRAALEGPVEDVFASRFLIVYGTTARDSWERRIVREEAEHFVQEWQKRYTSKCRIKPDHAVTRKEAEQFNLVLYGRPEANRLTAELMPSLPIQIVGNRATVGDRAFEGTNVGVKFCYPNPWNTDRYVAVFAGTTWQAQYQVNGRFGNWFDWGTYDNRNWFDFGVFDNRTRGPDTFLCVGFFDQDWQFDRSTMWVGAEGKRQQVRPRRLPAEREAGRGTEVHLSDLFPAARSQDKGCVGFDCSMRGPPTRAGTVVFEKGLGVRAPCWIEFDTKGEFGTFLATAGIDYEGRKPREARIAAEAIRFVVYGDGVRLAESPTLTHAQPSHEFRVEISGVRELRLTTEAASGSRWLFGGASWGNARVVRER